METIKIQISEVEGMTIKIPTEFTAPTFKKFYNQMLSISRTMPTSVLSGLGGDERKSHHPKIVVPLRLRMREWSSKEDCLGLLKVWETRGKEESINWIKKNRGWELDLEEKAYLSNLVASFRAKFKKELAK